MRDLFAVFAGIALAAFAVHLIRSYRSEIRRRSTELGPYDGRPFDRRDPFMKVVVAAGFMLGAALLITRSF